MLRRLLLNIHMYGGLLVSGYLIVLGVSSLNFNHHFLPEPSPPVSWSADVAAPTVAGESLQPESIRDQLGLFGSVGKQSIKTSSAGLLTFTIYRPGRTYDVSATPTGHIDVKETRATWFLLQAMHGSKGSPGSTWMSIWGVYTEVTTAFGMIAIVSGIYLFTSTRRDRKAGLLILLVTTGVSLAAMAYMHFHG